jgi:hypothetical protein
MRDSTAFEQQIHHIYELVSSSGAAVTWDDRIPDPDNPSRTRQVDITIRQDGKLTLVECRYHQDPQDVQWIEELHGRQASLLADATIAVSSSGFTAGARNKAKRFNIVLRDLEQLTDAEVMSWGYRAALTLYFYKFSDLEIDLLFAPASISKLDGDLLRSELKPSLALHSLFDQAAQQLGKLKLLAEERLNVPIDFRLHLKRDGFTLCGERVFGIRFTGKAQLVARELTAMAAFTYDEPGHHSPKSDVAVETFDLGATSVIHEGARISILLDASELEMPPLSLFRFFRVAGKQEMVHESLELAAWEKLWNPRGSIAINILTAAYVPAT